MDYSPWGHKESDTTEQLHSLTHGYSLWSCKELDMSEQLHFHFTLMASSAFSGTSELVEKSS